MQNQPEPVVTPRGPDPTQTGEVGSEGGGPGDMLQPSIKPGRDGADRKPGGLSALIWVVLGVPVVLVLLWFATSLG